MDNISEQEIHQRLRTAVDHAAPDPWDRILASCEAQKGTVIPMEEVKKQGLELLGVVPHDDTIYQYDCDGKPIVQLPADSPVRKALQEIVEKLGL